MSGSTEETTQIVHSQFFLGPLEKNGLKGMKVQKDSYHQKNNWGNPPYLDASPGKITTHGDFAKHRASLRGDLGPFHSLQARDNEGDDSKTSKVQMFIENKSGFQWVSENLEVLFTPTHSHTTPTHSHMTFAAQN